MVISEKLLNELQYLNKETESILLSNSLTDIQAETFFRNLEKRRYNILSEIKQYNSNTSYEYEKVKTIDNEYKAEILDNILIIYVKRPPAAAVRMPSRIPLPYFRYEQHF